MLKTDYKDAMYDGQRRYRLLANEDGTYSLPDETTYTQKGDMFGGNDINNTNKSINRINHVTPVTLAAADWIGDVVPYTQTVTVTEATADLEPILVSSMAVDAPLDIQKAYIKAFGIISSGTAVLSDGAATFKVYKKPDTDCIIGLKGV